jgi:hypothetical protein
VQVVVGEQEPIASDGAENDLIDDLGDRHRVQGHAGGVYLGYGVFDASGSGGAFPEIVKLQDEAV